VPSARRERLIEIGKALRRLALERLHVLGDRHCLVVRGKRPQLGDLSFKISDRSFKIEI
jgi:hypothetical protein